MCLADTEIRLCLHKHFYHNHNIVQIRIVQQFRLIAHIYFAHDPNTGLKDMMVVKDKDCILDKLNKLDMGLLRLYYSHKHFYHNPNTGLKDMTVVKDKAYRLSLL